MYRYFTKSSPLPTYLTVPDRSLFIIPKFNPYSMVPVIQWRHHCWHCLFHYVCRFELALEVQRWTRARSECLPGGPKNYSHATEMVPVQVTQTAPPDCVTNTRLVYVHTSFSPSFHSQCYVTTVDHSGHSREKNFYSSTTVSLYDNLFKGLRLKICSKYEQL